MLDGKADRMIRESSRAKIGGQSSASATPAKSATLFYTSATEPPLHNPDTTGETPSTVALGASRQNGCDHLVTPSSFFARAAAAVAAAGVAAAGDERTPTAAEDSPAKKSYSSCISSPMPTATTTPGGSARNRDAITADSCSKFYSYADGPDAAVKPPAAPMPCVQPSTSTSPGSAASNTSLSRSKRTPRILSVMDRVSASASRSNSSNNGYASSSNNINTNDDNRWYSASSRHSSYEPNAPICCSCQPPERPDNWTDSMWRRYLASMARLPCRPCGWAGGVGPVLGMMPADLPQNGAKQFHSSADVKHLTLGQAPRR